MTCLPRLPVSLLAALVALTACGSEPAPDAAEPAATATDQMSMGQEPAETVAAKSSGTITAIDSAAGKVTLDHAAIPEAGWPAMTMAFDADPALLGGLAVGDKVAFDVEIAGSAGKVTAIARQ